MKLHVKHYFALGLLAVTLLVSVFPIFTVNVVSGEIQGVEPSSVDYMPAQVINWHDFWRKFRKYALWDLEWFDGDGWVSRKSSLKIIRDYPNETTCKITLNFTSQEAGNYRLTFAINRAVKNYTVIESKFRYRLTIIDKPNRMEYTVVFDWSDLKDISGLQFNHGVKDEYFWFRIRRDNVPADYNLVLDPSTVAEDVNVFATEVVQPHRRTFYANGRHWVFYYDGVFNGYKSSTDGETWSTFTMVATPTIFYTYNPTDDSYISSGSPNGNFDTLNLLLWRPTVRDRILTKFDISGLPSGRTIISAKLKLYYYSTGYDPVGENVDIHRITEDSWVEETVTWNNAPSFDASATDTIIMPASYGWIEWDVTDDVASWYSGESTNYGHLLKFQDEASPQVTAHFYDKEENGYDPVLEVELTGSSSPLDLIVWFNGTYIHYARYNPEPKYDLFYRRGVPESDGTITWCQDEQLVVDGNATIYYYDAMVSTDTSGYPWIACCRRYNSKDKPYAIKSSTNDGTWSTQSGFPYLVKDAEDSEWYVGVLPLTATKMYFIGMQRISAFLGWEYDGGWGAEEEIEATNMNRYFDTVTIGDNIYVAWHYTGGTLYSRFKESGSWGTRGTIATCSGAQTPQITKVDSDYLLIFYDYGIPVGVYYRYCAIDSGTWSSQKRIWQGENDAVVDRTITSFYQNYDNLMCLAWTEDPVGDPDYYVIYGVFEGDVDNIEVTITDMEGCGDWVFAEEKYYHFQAEVTGLPTVDVVDTVKIAFNDTVNWINATYDYVDGTFGLEAGSDFVSLSAGSVTTSGKNLTVVFEIYFKSMILDALDVDIWMWSNNTGGTETGPELMQTDYFNIYNLGGYSELTVTGNAGRVAGGDVFDLYAWNGSNVEASTIFRNLQHVKMLPEVTAMIGGTYSSFDIYYYMDYCTNVDDWIEGWKVKLHSYGVFTGSVRSIIFNVTWYNRGVVENEEDVYFYHTGVGADENTTFRFWVDLWFNKINASSTVGGRVNAYYFPMEDTANSWLIWLTGSNWGIDDDKPKETLMFTDLKDANNETLQTPNIKLVKVGAKLQVNNDGSSSHFVCMKDYDVFDLTIGSSPLEGIQTPVFDETKVPVMPQGGFIGAITSGLVWLGKRIADIFGPGLLWFWNSFVGFMDAIASWLGFPNAFSNFINFLTNLGSWVWNGITWVVSLLGTGFSFLLVTMTKFLNTLATVVSNFVSVIQGVWNFLDNGFNSGINVWNDLGGVYWVQLIAIIYPIYLVFMWEEQGLDAVINHLRFIMDVLTFIARIFISVIQLFIDVIGRIIESIPIVE